MAEPQRRPGRPATPRRGRRPAGPWHRLNVLRRRVVDIVRYDVLVRTTSKPPRRAREAIPGLLLKSVEPGSVHVRGGGAVLEGAAGAARMARKGNATRLWWAATIDDRVVCRIIAIIPGTGRRPDANLLGRPLTEKDAYVTGLWVDPEYRSRNLTGTLLAPWIEQLKERGVEDLWAVVNRRNRASRVFCHIVGFHTAGELLRLEVLDGKWTRRLRAQYTDE